MYLLKVNNSNTRKRRDTCLKLTKRHRKDVIEVFLVSFFVDFQIIPRLFFSASIVDFEKTNVYLEVFSCQERAMKITEKNNNLTL